ncbi:MAG: hypothetical protein LBE34_15480 [Flavobacteriaceae bacterium]|jgi:hypothetical protein|nr:hypothetical protein [Flavobacteriaceae bacterium]
MNKILIAFMLFSFLTTVTSCKEKQGDEEKLVEVNNNLTVVDDSVSDELLEILTKEEDLLTAEYTEVAVKKGIEVFNQINTFKEWAQVSTVEFTTEKGEGTAKLYYNKEMQVDKIVVREYDKEHQSLNVYYLQDKKPVLVINQSLVYNDDLTNKQFSKEESEYSKDCNYFVDGRLYAIVSNLDCGAPFAEEYVKEVEKDILEEIKKLIP